MPGKATVQPADQTDPEFAVTAPSPAQTMLRKMAGMATADATERRTSVEDLNVILTASDEEFWDSDERGSINAKMLSGVVLEITGFDVKFGEGAVGDDDITSPFVDPASGRQMYLLVHSTIIDKSQQQKLYVLPKEHEPFDWNTSARFVVAKLMSALNRGWLDNSRTMRVRIVGTPIGNGKKRVEKLKDAEAPFIRSEAQNGSDEPPF